MPQHTIKHPLTFSLFVGIMSTIAIFCTLTGAYILYNEACSNQPISQDSLILWAIILPISLLLSILLGKHCYRKTAPEYINTVFKGKMAILYSVLITILITLGMFYSGIFFTLHWTGFVGKSYNFMFTWLCIYTVICLIVGITSGIFSYKKVKASVVDEMTDEE